MPTYTIADPGTYHVWAAPGDQHSPVTITVQAVGAVIAQAYWSTTPVALEGMPCDDSATQAEVRDVPAGATVHTSPDTARLIIRRPGDRNPVYDSSSRDDDPAQHPTLPKPRAAQPDAP